MSVFNGTLRLIKIRVWNDELPPLRWGEGKHIQKSIASQASEVVTASTIAVEVFIPKGARFFYGLLGARFCGEVGDRLVISVDRCTVECEIGSWTLAGNLDVVHDGIPDWTAEKVISGAEKTLAIHPIGSGALTFGLGAHGDIGSNVWTFQKLAEIIVILLTSDRSSEHNVLEVVKKHLSETTIS